MHKYRILFLHVFFFSTLLFAVNSEMSPSQKHFANEASAVMKKLLRQQQPVSKFLSNGALQRYYKRGHYRPFWFDAEGIKSIAVELINAVENDPVLKPASNTVFGLRDVVLQISTLESAADAEMETVMRLDATITGIYDEYMKRVASGTIDWKEFQLKLEALEEEKKILASWDRYGAYKNRVTLLYKALETDDIYSAVNAVNYTYPMAKKLEQALEYYEKIAHEGGYIQLPEFQKLSEGDSDPVVVLLRERLIQSGELNSTTCLPEESNVTHCLEYFDSNVKRAVKTFQRNHGLSVDGVVGPDTRKHLNITIEEKIATIRLNLERMRWLPRTLGKRYVLVNIADYKLLVIDEGNVSLEMPIVVGEKRHPTPVFSNKMSSVVLNPYWRVPQSIVKRELVPKLVKDPYALVEQGMRMHADWNESSPYYDFGTIDWSVYLQKDDEEENFEVPMRFIQIPSSQNPLGRVKFMFPNKYSVYIHDTSVKRYFRYRQRAFSHGCIRVSKPDALLQSIAKVDKNVNYDEVQELLKEKHKTKIGLETKIPIHVVYLTSWVSHNGAIQFRDDIYSYDTMQNELLNKAVVKQ